MGTIDVHHHFIPQRFRERKFQQAKLPPCRKLIPGLYVIVWFQNIEKARGLVLPQWSEEATLKILEDVGIRTAILSMGHPVHPYVQNPAEVAPICREINEYTAKFRDRHPDKIGFFATLPSLSSTSDCLRVISHAFDTLHADGVVIFSCYNGAYLGHPLFRPFWEEMDRRGAAVLIHPGFDGMRPIEEPLIAPPVIDWTHETTRTACHLIIGNVMRDFTRCKIILSHAGGSLPYVINRAANLCARLRIVDKTEEEFVEEGRNFYCDVAFSGHEPQLRLLKEFAKPGHVLYGSDFPWEDASTLTTMLKATNNVFAEETRKAGLTLFPRLAKSA